MDELRAEQQEQQQEQQNTGLGCHTAYAKSKRGTLKGLQLICDVVVLILASLSFSASGGFLIFVGIVCLFGSIFHFLLHFFGFSDRIKLSRGWNFIEFCAHAFYTLLYLIGAIVASALAGLNIVLMVASIFAYVATALYGVDMLLFFIAWRKDQRNGNSNSNSQPAASSSAARSDKSTPSRPAPPPPPPASSGPPSYDQYVGAVSAVSTAANMAQQYDSRYNQNNTYSVPDKW